MRGDFPKKECRYSCLKWCIFEKYFDHMKHTIVIDDKTKAGAGLLEIARSMSKLYKSVSSDRLRIC